VVATTGDYAVGQVTGAAPLASPTFTGVPLAPTAANGTNTTQIATCAFVLANAGSAAAGGSPTQIQFNNSGAFGGDSSLVFTAATKTVTQTGTTPSSTAPNTVTGLIGWYKADALALADGAAVATWTDSSTSANHATQATGANQPIFKAGLLNGKPVIRFDGVNDFMTFTSRYSTIQTAFFVVKTTTPTTQQILLGDSTTFDWFADASSRFFGSFASATITGGAGYDNGTPDSPISLIKPSSYRIIAVAGTAANLHAERITNDRTFGFYWNGDFAEILLYNAALSAGDLQTVLDYLSAKYAIPVANTALSINHESEWKSAGGDLHTYVDAFGDLHIPSVPKGQILITGDNGLISFDPSGLTYDATNKRLGINSPAPASKLEVISGDNAVGTIIGGFYSANMQQGVQFVYNGLFNVSNNDIVLQGGGGKVAVYAGTASAQLHVLSSAAGTVGQIVQAAASPTVDLVQIQANGTAVLFAHDKLGRPYTGNTTPTTAAGTGAGTTPTISVAGTDVNGVLSVTTGTGSPATAATIVTLTFSTVYGTAPKTVILTPANAAAAALSGATQVFAGGITTGKFDVTSGSAALAISTLYKWYYQVLG
jgi:hypothetical protein